jgi:8-oxo-dGTP pyrophosphatase MutT (NUDIX family)
MNFSDFKKHIPILIASKLGGLEAQFKLAPELRLRYDENKIKANKPKKAAVLALFYPDNENKTCFLLTKRASYKGTHSAQISFPGGKIEKEDLNLEDTAKRESFEEVGIQQSEIKIIRELTDVYIPPSNFLATPFIGYLATKPNFITNHEVATNIEVLLEDLLNEQSITTVEMTTSYMDKINVPCFKLNGYIVWGATAMMLAEIKDLLNS